MIKGIKVELTIKDNATGVYLKVPVVPETIPYTDGDAIYDTVKILNLGNVETFNGVDLDSCSWSSFFPARYDAAYCSTQDLKTPIDYRNIFSGWKDNATSLQIICPAAGINKEMQLRTFYWELEGFEGDITYSVTFKERKELKPLQIDVSQADDGTIKVNSKPTYDSRPSLPEGPLPDTYKIQGGDTLTGIAKKLPVRPSWQPLYTANKSLIGPDPGKIYPGQVLKVPTA